MLSKNQIDQIFTPDTEKFKTTNDILIYFKLSLLEHIKQYNFTISYSFIEIIIDSTINSNSEQKTDINISTLTNLQFLCLLNLFYVNCLNNHKLNNVLYSLQVMQGPIGICYYLNRKVIEQRTVECVSRRCSTKYSIETIQDLTQTHNINIETELLTMLSNQLVDEVVDVLVQQLDTINADSITKGLYQSYDECGINTEDYVEFDGKLYPNFNSNNGTGLAAPFIVAPYSVNTSKIVDPQTFQPLVSLVLRQGIVHINKQYKNIVVANSK